MAYLKTLSCLVQWGPPWPALSEAPRTYAPGIFKKEGTPRVKEGSQKTPGPKPFKTPRRVRYLAQIRLAALEPSRRSAGKANLDVKHVKEILVGLGLALGFQSGFSSGAGGAWLGASSSSALKLPPAGVRAKGPSGLWCGASWRPRMSQTRAKMYKAARSPNRNPTRCWAPPLDRPHETVPQRAKALETLSLGLRCPATPQVSARCSFCKANFPTGEPFKQNESVEGPARADAS